MEKTMDPHLSQSDSIVLEALYQDIKIGAKCPGRSENLNTCISRLKALNDPSNPNFEQPVFSKYDDKDITPWVKDYLFQPYRRLATRVVRHPTDVVFLTNILWNSLITLPSAIYLFYNFTYIHGLIHTVHAVWCAGPFTLVMHNHIHRGGVLAKSWKWVDNIFPYILEPLLGHTWDSYYYHHVKHHHVEANGPDDLSSTIRYQRDELLHFLHYEARFLFFIWLELPLYFFRKRQMRLALQAFISEMASYAFLYFMTTQVNLNASIFALLIPFMFLRLALMIGNWGQHALVDEVEPDDDLRSSITLIDVPSNRFCFNDGYHTSHHLNPLRHWREQPVHFMQQSELFANNRALVFHDIDFLMMTIKLLCKDYMYLAERLIPIGDQVNMTVSEIAQMLRTKTRKFTEEDIRQKFKHKDMSQKP